MNFKRQLIGPEITVPRLDDDVVEDRQIGGRGGDVEIKGFQPQQLTQQPTPFGAGRVGENRQVFPLPNRRGWNATPTSFRIGATEDEDE